ncbi:MAG: hypothetical protein ABFS32_19105, partial [Bacteroidota bacterium]
MAVTRLKRKARRNRLKSKVRAQKMKLEGFVPVIKQVDTDAAKEEFKAKASKAKPKAVKKEEVAKPAEKAKADTKAAKPKA